MAEAFKIRLDVETKRRWQAAASEEGVSLAEWVRRRCEAGLPPKEIRVVTDVWLPGTFEVFPLAPTVHVDGSPPIDPEEPTAQGCAVEPMVGSIPPIDSEEVKESEPPQFQINWNVPVVLVPAGGFTKGPILPQEVLDEIIPKPKPKPKSFNFSRCIQPQLLCQFRNMPLCGPCKELNQ